MGIITTRVTGAMAVAAAIMLTGLTPARAADLDPVDAAHSSAVVIMYHRFGESQYPTTSIRLDQFDAHIKELTSGKYHVLPLPEIIAAIRDKKPLPDRTVAITIDDAFESVYREAWPRLRAAHLPFTLFTATGQLGETPDAYMSWAQLRELVKSGEVTVGNHSVTHAHLADQGAARIRQEYAKSNARFEKELGFRPTLQAYPYGEASAKVIAAARAAGFVASFGQHSGVVSDTANMDYLPRFALNEHYGEEKRFKLAINALPIYATDVSPDQSHARPQPAGVRLHRARQHAAPRPARVLLLPARQARHRAPRRPAHRGAHAERLQARARPHQLHAAGARRSLALVRHPVLYPEEVAGRKSSRPDPKMASGGKAGGQVEVSRA